MRCNDTLQFAYDKEAISYTHNVLNTVAYHKHLANKSCRALVYRYLPLAILLNVYYSLSTGIFGAHFCPILIMHACDVVFIPME